MCSIATAGPVRSSNTLADIPLNRACGSGSAPGSRRASSCTHAQQYRPAAAQSSPGGLRSCQLQQRFTSLTQGGLMQCSLARAGSMQCSPVQCSPARISRTPRMGGRGNPPRLRLTRRGRIVLIGLPLVLLAALLISLGGLLNSPAKAADTANGLSVTETVTVTVQPGESLWAIAVSAAPNRDARDTIAD